MFLSSFGLGLLWLLFFEVVFCYFVHKKLIKVRMLFHFLLPRRSTEIFIYASDVSKVVMAESHCWCLHDELGDMLHLHVHFRCDSYLCLIDIEGTVFNDKVFVIQHYFVGARLYFNSVALESFFLWNCTGVEKDRAISFYPIIPNRIKQHPSVFQQWNWNLRPPNQLVSWHSSNLSAILAKGNIFTKQINFG